MSQEAFCLYLQCAGLTAQSWPQDMPLQHHVCQYNSSPAGAEASHRHQQHLRREHNGKKIPHHCNWHNATGGEAKMGRKAGCYMGGGRSHLWTPDPTPPIQIMETPLMLEKCYANKRPGKHRRNLRGSNGEAKTTENCTFCQAPAPPTPP